MLTISSFTARNSFIISAVTDGSVRICEIQRSEEHTSELQSRVDLVCRLLLAPLTSVTYTLSLHDALPISSPIDVAHFSPGPVFEHVQPGVRLFIDFDDVIRHADDLVVHGAQLLHHFRRYRRICPDL